MQNFALPIGKLKRFVSCFGIVIVSGFEDMGDFRSDVSQSALGVIDRLYVLATDREGNRRIVLLAPNTLQYVGQSGTILKDPFGILTVRRQVPAGQ